MVKQSENTHKIVAEESCSKGLERALSTCDNATCSYVKACPDSKEFLEEFKQAVRKFCSRKSNDLWRSAAPQVDIKFVDREVNSSSYEIFLNYMRNRKLSFELHETISDFLMSERKSKCSYIIVSSEYANFTFNNHSRVFCFCSRNDLL